MSFIDGTKDRYGNSTTPTYEDAVTNPPPGEMLSSVVDESALDPYELRHAK